ncbi:MAG: hypothetical protein IPG53_23675 [Ignavibacteriales bacterium]|nr:hypothetical protein [Ignavibacteriales bacterium]
MLLDNASDLLNDGKIIGVVSRKNGIWPRAWGNRSIIGDARNPEMQKKMNLEN